MGKEAVYVHRKCILFKQKKIYTSIHYSMELLNKYFWHIFSKKDIAIDILYRYTNDHDTMYYAKKLYKAFYWQVAISIAPVCHIHLNLISKVK